MLITTYFLCTWAGVQVMACKDKGNKGTPPPVVTPKVLIRTTQSTSEEDEDTVRGGESHTDLTQILHTLYG